MGRERYLQSGAAPEGRVEGYGVIRIGGNLHEYHDPSNYEIASVSTDTPLRSNN